MNNRLQEIAKECLFDEIEKDYSLYFNLTKEKVDVFARLVIREALSLRSDMSSLEAFKEEEFGSAQLVRVADKAFDLYYDKISSHFGISEISPEQFY
jgi:hypothetical protein